MVLGGGGGISWKGWNHVVNTLLLKQMLRTRDIRHWNNTIQTAHTSLLGLLAKIKVCTPIQSQALSPESANGCLMHYRSRERLRQVSVDLYLSELGTILLSLRNCEARDELATCILRQCTGMYDIFYCSEAFYTATAQVWNSARYAKWLWFSTRCRYACFQTGLGFSWHRSSKHAGM